MVKRSSTFGIGVWLKLSLLISILLISFTETNEKPLSQVRVEKKADFRIAYAIVRNYEGGYGNLQYDRGGETYAGIVRKWSKDWYGWRYIDAKKRKHEEIVPEAEFWVQDYYLSIWVREEWNELKDQQTANYLFEFRILSRYSSIGIINQSLNGVGSKTSLSNEMNEQTAIEINRANKNLLLKEVRERRMNLYTSIVYNDSTQRKWKKGWMKRAKNI